MAESSMGGGADLSFLSLAASVVISALGAVVCHHLIIEYIPVFIARKMYGNDQCKKSDRPVPEPMGIICAGVWLTCVFVFIPFPFLQWTTYEAEFPHAKFYGFLSALLSISSAILLGFIDDVLDLRWRHKLLFPTLSTLPVLMVYYLSGSSTTVILPPVLRRLAAPYGLELPSSLDIHALYYIYMGMLIVFCTNAINILAGINGLEVGQAIVLAASILLFNVIQLFRMETEIWYHSLSIYLLLPFLATSLVLYYFNKCPATVFVGDTFCYWSGMTLAVVAILGHFSKTLILFLVPQVANFLYSIPQLFHLVPCPRHRLPKYDATTDTVGMSYAEFTTGSLSKPGELVLSLFEFTGLLYREEFNKDGKSWTRVNNQTIINLVLKNTGRIHEAQLTSILLAIQVFFSFLAFFIRFGLAQLFYDVVY